MKPQGEEVTTKRAVVGLRPSNQIHDVFNYYVPPPKPGASAPAAGRISTELKGMISHLVASEKFPFKNESDLVRAAVIWFMESVVVPGSDKRFQNDFHMMRDFIRDSQQVARINNVTEFERQVRKSLEDLMGQGAKDAAVQVYRGAIERTENFHEPMRTHALNYLKTNVDFTEVRAELEKQEELIPAYVPAYGEMEEAA